MSEVVKLAERGELEDVIRDAVAWLDQTNRMKTMFQSGSRRADKLLTELAGSHLGTLITT